jgi:signal transduction histidine kinase/ligand-binding sensor domain-containing protein
VLFVDSKDALWVGTASDGIFRISGNSVDHFSNADGLSSDSVERFFEDREGTLWIASTKGIDSFRDLPVVSFSIKEGLASDSISTILASREGGVWIGGAEALGLLREGHLSAIRSNQGLPGRDITTMFEDHLGRLWIGVDSDLVLLDHRRFFPIRRPDGTSVGIVFAITEDANYDEWFVTNSGLFRIEKLTVRRELPLAENCFSLVADPKEGVWLGLENGDLLRYRRGRTETFAADPKTGTAPIRMLLLEFGSGFWEITGDGLIRWNGNKRALLSTRNGLPCNEIYSAVKDAAGTLWLYARCGLISITPSELDRWRPDQSARVKVGVLDVYDGVEPGIAPLQPQSTRSLDGRLWFANNNIVQTFDPRTHRKNPLPPNVVVERIVANGISFRLQGDLRLPAHVRNLEIDFTALSFVVPAKVRFRYKLEGHESEWQDSRSRRQAFYSDLPPGQYHFRVIACNNDGVWNQTGATLDFGIAPAFYETGWFKLFCIVAAGCLVWWIYVSRVRLLKARLNMQFKERLSERTRIAQELHDTLLQGAQSASMLLSLANDQLAADAPAKPLVLRVLELQRRLVEEGRNAIFGLRLSHEERQSVEQAFYRIPGELAVRGTTDFRVVVEGASRALHPVVREELYGIGREALANAFRHSGATSITVTLAYGNHEMRLAVSDNGCGIDTEVLHHGRKGHWGLSGMRERAERIGGKLRVSNNALHGTEVELCVPGRLAFRSRNWFYMPGWFWKLVPRRLNATKPAAEQKVEESAPEHRR